MANKDEPGWLKVNDPKEYEKKFGKKKEKQKEEKKSYD